jgi:hypothetical protein
MSIKSYFKPMTPGVVSAKPLSITLGEKTSKLPSQSSQDAAKPTPLVPIKAELMLEIVDKPEKQNCAWAWVERKNNAPGVQRIGVALNRAQWPVGGALERGDKQAVRWLFGVALLERISFAPRGSAAHGLRWHIVRTVMGDMAQPWQSVLWCAYLLKDHPLFSAIDQLPIYGAKPVVGSHLVTTISLEAGG